MEVTLRALLPKLFPDLHDKSLSGCDPDQLTNAAELVKNLTGTRAKVNRSEMIAKQMQPERNRSRSFQVFVNGLCGFLAE